MGWHRSWHRLEELLFGQPLTNEDKPYGALNEMDGFGEWRPSTKEIEQNCFLNDQDSRFHNNKVLVKHFIVCRLKMF